MSECWWEDGSSDLSGQGCLRAALVALCKQRVCLSWPPRPAAQAGCSRGAVCPRAGVGPVCNIHAQALLLRGALSYQIDGLIAHWSMS